MEQENEFEINPELESMSEDCGVYLGKNYPRLKYKLDKTNRDWGAKEASYLVGFAGAINQLGLSEETLSKIINNKIILEYQKEILRMKLESDERIAGIVSKCPVQVVREE